MPKVQEVEEVVEDFIVDEDDYSSEFAAAVDDEAPEEVDTSSLTSTSNFMNAQPEIVDEIVDLGVVVKEPEASSYVVRVIEDVGPVYYGPELVELKRGRRYRVPAHIHRYLSDRSLLWEQQ